MSELNLAKLRRLGRLVFMARCVVMWEKLWPRLWPFLILVSLFGITILFDLFSLLPASLHMLMLGAVSIGGIGFFVKAIRPLSWPTQSEALHRLEKDSDLKNQPLFVLLDYPAGQETNKFSQSLWLNHQDRMAAAMAHVTLSLPRSNLWKKDPYSFRALLILLLVLGVIEARDDMGDRLKRAFIPVSEGTFFQSWKVHAWITPPDHTGLSGEYLEVSAKTDAQNSILQIAQFSKILIRLEGKPTRDDITVSMGPFVEKMESLGNGNFSLETQMDQGESLKLLRAGEVLYQWPVQIVADMPPEISLKGRPQSGFRGHFTLDYHAEDDYGLREVSLEIQPLERSDLESIILKSSLNTISSNGSFRQNLAHHPLAGREVIVTPKVKDNGDQTSIGQAVRLILPERKFSHILAVRLINVRKALYDATPEDKIYSRLWLDRILDRPEDFNHEISVYFALRVATDRLYAEMPESEVRHVQEILWQTAVHLDEGAAGTERNQLEFMSRQLQEMMQNPKQKASMEALFEKMRQSLEKYLQHMGKANGDIKGLEDALGPENADMVGRDELLELLERARDLMRAGNIEAAKAVMEQFQSILSRIAMQKPVDPVQAKAAQEIMQNLKDIQQDQQDLMDRTFQRTRNQNKPSLNSTQKAIKEAEEQEKIKDRLKAQMQRLKDLEAKIPEALRDAQRSMMRAAQSLHRGLDEDAVQAQMRAVDQLNKGTEQSAQSLAQKMGHRPMQNQMPGYDPFGRGMPGRIDAGSGKDVPSAAEMHRSREILQELYRRAGQKGRADQELKYIERLLERF